MRLHIFKAANNLGAAAVGMENAGGWGLEICSLHCFPEQVFGLFCIICVVIDGIPAPIKTWIYNMAILLEFLLFQPNLKCFLVVQNTFGYGFFFNGYFYFSHPLFFISQCLVFNHSHYLPPFPDLLLIICGSAQSSGFLFFFAWVCCDLSFVIIINTPVKKEGKRKAFISGRIWAISAFQRSGGESFKNCCVCEDGPADSAVGFSLIPASRWDCWSWGSLWHMQSSLAGAALHPGLVSAPKSPQFPRSGCTVVRNP